MDLSTINVISLESVTTFDRSSNSTVVDASTYRLSNNRVVFYSITPSSDTREIDAVTIAVTAGFGALSTDMPDNITNVLAMYVANGLRYKGFVINESLNETIDTAKASLMKYNSTRNWIT